jgi:hypothetical protein
MKATGFLFLATLFCVTWAAAPLAVPLSGRSVPERPSAVDILARSTGAIRP